MTVYLSEVRERGVVVQYVWQIDQRPSQHVNLMFAVVDALLKTRKVPTDAHSKLHRNSTMTYAMVSWLVEYGLTSHSTHYRSCEAYTTHWKKAEVVAVQSNNH